MCKKSFLPVYRRNLKHTGVCKKVLIACKKPLIAHDVKLIAQRYVH